MKLEECVPSRELCQKWKEVGGRQDTVFYWALAWNNWNVTPAKNCREWAEEDKIAAPLASELMEWMKGRNDIGSMRIVALIMNYLNSYYLESIANALMKMAIELEEAK